MGGQEERAIPRRGRRAGYGKARRASDTLHKVKEGSSKDMFQNYDIVKARINRIKEELMELESLQRQLLEGDLICAKNETRYKWYLSNQGKSQYLARKELELAEKLALKKYYESKHKDLQCELEACEAYVCVAASTEADRAEQILLHPEYERLLAGEFASRSKELEEWRNADYERCQNYPEKLLIKGTQGKMLRSKSEAMIDRVLFAEGIPFRYEEKIVLGGTILYPDFTIRHPKTGEFFYWEHFGMMDNAEYINHACKKFKIYCENGIIPSVSLILSYETQEHPFSINEAERIVTQYFL